jgi:flagellar hook-associated protein 2
MGIQVDGLISGMDTTALIESIVSLSKAPIRTYEDKLTVLSTQKGAVANLVNLMGTMEDYLEELEVLSDFRVFSAEYPLNDSVRISVDGSAVAGTYEVEVQQLANSEMEVSDGFSDNPNDEGVITEGTFTVTYNGVDTDVVIDATNSSYNGLAAELDAIVGLNAYVVDTGVETDPYRLVVQGEDTGADYTVDVSALPLTMTKNSVATDAKFTVNGIAFENNGNEVTEALPGMSITISEVTTEAIAVVVDQDTAEMVDKVEDFVYAFNNVINYIDTQSDYDVESGIRGSFVGESTVRRVRNGLRTIVTAEYDGLGQDKDALSFLGITSDSHGKLTIDAAELEEALLDHTAQIEAMFTSDDGVGKALLAQIDVYTDGIDGTLTMKTDSIEAQIDDVQDMIADYEDRADTYEARLREQFINMETTLGKFQGVQLYLSTMLFDNND